MKNFITNSGAENLKNRLTELITSSEELKFLVGFFYFSGLEELYLSLKSNPNVILKVLVGLNVDDLNYQLVEIADLDDQSGRLSNNDIANKFFTSVKKSINTETFDNKDFYEQSKFFLDLIKNNRLIIRKTLKPNHAKLYLFKLGSGQVARKELFITGSSNLTKPGLTTQEEFNVEISDFGLKEAEEYFDTLWEPALKITEEDIYRNRIIEILQKETLIMDITPYEAYALVLKAYLDSHGKKDIRQSLIEKFEKNGYTPYKYQLDAIGQALSIIERNNGVILADVVGLGKTVIACAVANQIGKRGVIICPPGIAGDPRKKDAGWNMYKEQFGLYDWEVWSLGDLEKLQDRLTEGKLNDIDVVIVDEAHRFRNQDTKTYEYLKNICRGKTVILLTATPFNNRPADILSLLSLFITPKKSTITLEDSLVDKFRAFRTDFDHLSFILKNYKSSDKSKRDKVNYYYKALFGEEFEGSRALSKVKGRSKYLAKQIRDVIEPVTIRRNRLDLLNNPYYNDEVKNLSKVKDPQELFFELTKEQSEFYDKVIKYYFADPDEGGQFKGAIYRPAEYEKERKDITEDKLSESERFEFYSQYNLYNFMRRLLVKRFESSFGSFEQSLKNFRRITDSTLKFVEKTKKFILDRSLIDKIYEKDLDEIEKELIKYSEKIDEGLYPENRKIYEVSKFKYEDEFIKDIESDLKLFDDVLDMLHGLDLVKDDPKSKCLVNYLKGQLQKEPDRKIAIFSEYVDTVKYLEPILEKEFQGKMLVVEGDLSSSKIEEINKNFDASYKAHEDKYDILLTSDKLSEGFNLNRAGMVINYDIPWNPVRVIQRVGRINRISKKVFDELYIINFFPTEKGAELVKSREIASNKMFLIHNTLGEDSKIFDIDEEPSPSGLYERIQQNPDKLEGESFYTKVVKEFDAIKEKSPELIHSLNKFPLRVKVAKKFNEDELLVFIKKSNLYVGYAKYVDSVKPEFSEMTFEDALDRIKCAPEEKPLQLSENFWDAYTEIKSKSFEKTSKSLPENSLEQKAINNIKTFLAKVEDDRLLEYKDFLNALLEGIIDYGTLPDPTLRRIANLESGNSEKIAKAVKELESLRKELRENFLAVEKSREKKLSKEVIVAIENQKEG